MHRFTFRFALVLPILALSHFAAGQTSVREEVGADGVTYRVTENTYQTTLPYTEYESRQERTLQPQLTTDYQSFQQTYAVPVTEYRWVSRMRGWWNPFARPYWTHNLEPFTRTDYRTATVQMPSTRTSWVEQTRTVQVPVTKYRTVQNTSSSRVAVNAPTSVGTPRTFASESGATAIASRPSDGRYGSERMTSDIPRKPTTVR